MRHRQPERYIRGVSITPGRATTYTMPESWIVNGRPTPTKTADKPQRSAEEKAAANRCRVISRYWQAVGWLWIRSKSTTVSISGGRKMRHRQGMLTLTLPGVATANHMQVKKLILDPFFTYCRNVLGLRNYVWVAELQERGEIHFHAIVNEFLDKDKVRAAWLRHCDNSGIIQGSTLGHRPATAIEACRSYKGSRSYAAKYLSKGLKSGAIVGRIWSGSHSVTGVGPISTNEVEQAFNAPAALREVDARTQGWRSYERGVRIARFDLARISYRSSPVLYSLFKHHLRKHDNPPAPHDHTINQANTSAPSPTSRYHRPGPSPDLCSGVANALSGGLQVHQRGLGGHGSGAGPAMAMRSQAAPPAPDLFSASFRHVLQE